jgi:hypothetical protein
VLGDDGGHSRPGIRLDPRGRRLRPSSSHAKLPLANRYRII